MLLLWEYFWKNDKRSFFPKSKGGKLTVWCCESCQTLKKNLTPEEFIVKIKSIDIFEEKRRYMTNSVMSLLYKTKTNEGIYGSYSSSIKNMGLSLELDCLDVASERKEKYGGEIITTSDGRIFLLLEWIH